MIPLPPPPQKKSSLIATAPFTIDASGELEYFPRADYNEIMCNDFSGAWLGVGMTGAKMISGREGQPSGGRHRRRENILNGLA